MGGVWRLGPAVVEKPESLPFSPIHRSAWKGNSQKSISRILHSPVPNGPGALRRNGASPLVLGGTKR